MLVLGNSESCCSSVKYLHIVIVAREFRSQTYRKLNVVCLALLFDKLLLIY